MVRRVPIKAPAAALYPSLEIIVRYFPKRQHPRGILPSGNIPGIFCQAATSQGYFPKRQHPRDIFPNGNIPGVFCQAATSQGYFAKRQHPRGILTSGNFSKVQFSQRQAPKPVLVTAFGPLPCFSHGAQHPSPS